MMMLAGPASVAEVPNGVFLTYLADAVGAVILYLIYRKGNIHPLSAVSVFMALSVVGFLMLFASEYVPWFAHPACVLIGFGFLPCQMMGLYGLMMMKSYPSRYIVPGIMGMALVTVLVHSALVEALRTMPNMLYLVYLAITVVSVLIYWHLSPYLVYAFQKKVAAESSAEEGCVVEISVSEAVIAADPRLSQLTARELEVLELIGGGYSNRDIADILVISQHTVNDYTKKIYRKLEVHSRHAAAQTINRYH